MLIESRTFGPDEFRNFPRETFEAADWLAVRKLAASMRSVGWDGDPVIVRAPDTLKNGFHRAHAAHDVGIDVEALVVSEELWAWAAERTSNDEEATTIILNLWDTSAFEDLDPESLRQAARRARDRRQKELDRLSDLMSD